MHRRIGMGGAVALGLSVFLAVPAAHADQTTTAPTAPTATATIHVPSGFDKQLEDTRANGYYQPVDGGLHIWTQGDPRTDGSQMKVAEYVDTNTPLANAGEPSLDYTPSRDGLTDPGFQLVVDLDGNGSADGILVGEPGAYGTHWWLPRAYTNVDLTQAPGRNDGYDHSGPLDAWRAAYPKANVLAFGFSLGSGVLGDGLLHAMNFANTEYTFAPDVILHSKDDCKAGGWATSTVPVYKNQGECVSHFATASNNGNGSGNGSGSAGLGAPVTTAPAAPTALTARNSGKIRAI